MTPHNAAQAGDYAEAVLLPGDPLRAKWVAETFLEDARQVNAVRNCLGFTGRWKGTPVSVQATGMGQPSLAIYVHELLNFYGVKTAIRIGTCGGLSRNVAVRDLIIAQAATTDSTLVRDAFGPYSFAPVADFGLLADAATRAAAAGLRAHIGNMLSSDVFYHADGLKAYETLIAHGVLGVEMETAALYTLCARFAARGLSICTMTDSLVTGEQLSAAERQSSLEDMVTLALDVATAAR
jgi:purine-nucleoside phosphorylase